MGSAETFTNAEQIARSSSLEKFGGLGLAFFLLVDFDGAALCSAAFRDATLCGVSRRVTPLNLMKDSGEDGFDILVCGVLGKVVDLLA